MPKKAILKSSMKILLEEAEKKLKKQGIAIAKDIFQMKNTQQYYALKQVGLSERQRMMCKLHKAGLSWKFIGECIMREFEEENKK